MSTAKTNTKKTASSLIAALVLALGLLAAAPAPFAGASFDGPALLAGSGTPDDIDVG